MLSPRAARIFRNDDASWNLYSLVRSASSEAPPIEPVQHRISAGPQKKAQRKFEVPLIELFERYNAAINAWRTVFRVEHREVRASYALSYANHASGIHHLEELRSAPCRS